jgi:hypothetical protein
LFRSLETVPGKFSEALLDTPTGAGVIRVVLPPIQYWLTTSNDAERRYLDTACRVHGSLEAALVHAAAAYPRGLAGVPNTDVALTEETNAAPQNGTAMLPLPEHTDSADAAPSTGGA